MSFLHITNPEQRNVIVEDYLEKLKNRSTQNQLKDTSSQEEYTKIEKKNHQETSEQRELNISNHCKIIQHFKNPELKTDGKYKMKNVVKLHIGNGIQFLPGDINGLQIKLDYLLAEYHAGNTSATRGQIVAITDELLRRKVISQAKYNSINTYIQK